MEARSSTTAEHLRLFLDYFIQDRSHGCLDYHLHPSVVLGDIECFPPILIILLMSNYLAEEMKCF